MKINISSIKTGFLRVMLGLMIISSTMPSALAARFYFNDNNDLMKGCPGSVDIMIDTEGADVLAADSTFSYNSDELSLGSVHTVSALPMETYNVITGAKIELSGARFGGTGSFNGTGIYGRINFTPDIGTNNGNFVFDPDLHRANVIAEAGTFANIITAAESKTFTFNDRYNTEVDGTGFCDPDTTPPTVTFILPPNGSGGNPVDTNEIFSLADDRAGVDISTLQYTIRGIAYTNSTPQTTVAESSGVYRVETDPDANFLEGENVQVSVYICDKNVPTNCTTKNGSFRIYTPPPPDPVCGDGIVTYSAGEQCDDGNLTDGDGCSALCLWEQPEAEPGPPIECPECPELEETICEEVADTETICHYPFDDSQNPYELQVPVNLVEEFIAYGDTRGSCPEAAEEIAPIRGCTRADVTQEILETFNVYKKYAASNAKCKEDLEHCMLPFLIHTNYQDVDLEAGKYFPDVYLAGGSQIQLQGENTVSKPIQSAIHFGTETGMVQGFYEDVENQSPFAPHQNMTRIQILKLLNWAVLDQPWEYYNEYTAKIGGEENLNNVKRYAPDLYEWWYPRYHTLACESGVLSCNTQTPFGSNEVCSVSWKRDIVARYLAYQNQYSSETFEDSDNDSIIDKDETYIFLTDPEDEDTDQDDLADGDEINIYRSNPLLTDSDYDNLTDGEEVNIYKTDPTNPDTDGDGFPDGLEVEFGGDPNDENVFPVDANQNGIDDEWELKYGLSPQNGSDDTDGDGLSDLMEYRTGTDPLNPDTDGDGMIDSDELLYGTNPLVRDTLADVGVRITNIRDGMILTDLRPLIQGVAPVIGADVELFLRNEFGHEILLGSAKVDESNIYIFNTPFDLRDGEFYLLAKMLDPEARRVVESPLIAVTLDSTLKVDEPTPERLSNVTITEEALLEDLRIEIKDQKPILIGRTGFNNRVIATWQSVIGTSAIVADLAGGEFRMEAPRDLAYGEHTVSVYSIREADQAVSKVVNLKFEVKEPFTQVLHGVAFGEEVIFPWYIWILIFSIGFGLVGFGIWLDRKNQREKTKK